MSAPGKSNQTVVTTAGSVTQRCHSCPRALPWPLAQPKCGGAAGASTHPGFHLILLLVHATQREDALEASPGLLPRFAFLSVTQSTDTTTFSSVEVYLQHHIHLSVWLDSHAHRNTLCGLLP